MLTTTKTITVNNYYNILSNSYADLTIPKIKQKLSLNDLENLIQVLDEYPFETDDISIEIVARGLNDTGYYLQVTNKDNKIFIDHHIDRLQNKTLQNLFERIEELNTTNQASTKTIYQFYIDTEANGMYFSEMFDDYDKFISQVKSRIVSWSSTFGEDTIQMEIYTQIVNSTNSLTEFNNSFRLSYDEDSMDQITINIKTF